MTTPTTQQISDNLIAQLQVAINQTIPLLPKSFERVLAKALGGLFVILYKYIGWGTLQGFVAFASDKPTIINGKTVTPLEAWGELIGVGLPVAATQAELTVDVQVDNQTGSIAAGELVLGVDNGVTYLTVTSVLLNAPVVQVNIRAAADQADGDGSGVQGNLQVGQEVTFARPLDQINRVGTVSALVVTAAEKESTTAYRTRVEDRFKRRAQGGAPSDYELWAEEVIGIINAYPYTSDCPGVNEVFVEATVASSGNADGIPTVAQLQAVRDSIDFDIDGKASRRQLGAVTNVLPITREVFDVQIANLVVTDPATVQANINAALVQYMADREPFIAGLSVLPRKDVVSRTTASGIVADVIAAANGQFSSLNLTVGAVATNQYSLGKGEKAKLGAVTFI
jgi:uncharacterized phage protein gp47/JayE